MSDSRDGLFGALFGRGAVDTGDVAWLQAMLDTEAALARAAERAGVVPAGAAQYVAAVAYADLYDIAELGRTAAATGNPVPGLVRAMTALVEADAPWATGAVHCGATSQDIIDTAAMLLARRALDLIGDDLAAAAHTCAELASRYSGAVIAGRTLLQQAVPVTFGLVAAGWLTAIDEARADLRRITLRLAIQFGGAAGTLASLGDRGPDVAVFLGDELALAVPVLPWHTDRRRIIELGAGLTGAAAVLGKIARDVTLLAQSEVGEVREAKGGGSSAMPNKQNPVASVLVLGCAKRVPGLLATLAAAAEQEHQRAAGAWHAEWETLSDMLRLTASAAAWTADLLADLRVDPARMSANLDAARGLTQAEHLAAELAPLIGRLQAHDLIAAAAKRAAESGTTLADALLADESAAAILARARFTRPKIESALRPESYLGATDRFVHAALTAHEAFESEKRRWPAAR